jgi:hypothetical protein
VGDQFRSDGEGSSLGGGRFFKLLDRADLRVFNL